MNEMNENEFDDKLMQAAAGLAKEVRPENDLWPGIEASITSSQGEGGWQWRGMFAQAAAVILLVGGSSGLTYLAVHEDRNPAVPVAPVGALEFRPVSGSFGSHYNLGPDFQDARDDLESKLQEELANLSPETRAEVDKNMTAIRNAIIEINKALAEEPDNVLLQDLLLSSYRKELALMTRVDGMASSVMRRNDI